MTIMFNTILNAAGFEESEVRLLRHKDKRATKGRTPFALWHNNRQQFELYQKIQGFRFESRLRALYWASFVGTPDNETLFVGIYRVLDRRILEHDTPMPLREGMDLAGTCHIYELELEPRLASLIGKLYIDWGPGKRAWIQRADRQNKRIIESTEFKESNFPGFLKLP